MTLSSAVSSFANSIYELLASFVNAFLAIINGAFGVVKGIGNGAVNLVAEAVRMLGGLGGFIAGKQIFFLDSHFFHITRTHTSVLVADNTCQILTLLNRKLCRHIRRRLVGVRLRTIFQRTAGRRVNCRRKEDQVKGLGWKRAQGHGCFAVVEARGARSNSTMRHDKIPDTGSLRVFEGAIENLAT